MSWRVGKRIYAYLYCDACQVRVYSTALRRWCVRCTQNRRDKVESRRRCSLPSPSFVAIAIGKFTFARKSILWYRKFRYFDSRCIFHDIHLYFSTEKERERESVHEREFNIPSRGKRSVNDLDGQDRVFSRRCRRYPGSESSPSRHYKANDVPSVLT